MKKETKVLFVCMGNICRSPAGEGILKSLARSNPDLVIHAQSCGIGDWHLGSAPDSRIQRAAAMRGVALTSKAQRFESRFFDEFDYILAADKEVLKYLYHYAVEPEQKNKISLMTAFGSTYRSQEVPDPYYQGEAAFDLVLDILEDSCEGLIKHLRIQEEK